MVSHVLDPRHLVVMGQDHGIAGIGQPAYFAGPLVEVPGLVQRTVAVGAGVALASEGGSGINW